MLLAFVSLLSLALVPCLLMNHETIRDIFVEVVIHCLIIRVLSAESWASLAGLMSKVPSRDLIRAPSLGFIVIRSVLFWLA